MVSEEHLFGIAGGMVGAIVASALANAVPRYRLAALLTVGVRLLRDARQLGRAGSKA